MSIRKYLREKGYENFEGSCYNQTEQQDLLKELIKNKLTGLEIGFNAGDSADVFLQQGVQLTSCDMFRHKYSFDACDFLRDKYNDKFCIVKGDSRITLPQIKDKFDFIYVDGCHSYPVVKQDLKNIVPLAHKDTLIIIDDYVVNPDYIRHYNKGVIRGVAEFEEFERIGQKDFGIGRGLIWGKLGPNQYQKDLEFGFKQEELIQPILEEKFGELKKLDRYNPFDYENDISLIELKSRHIKHDQYPTTMINYSKLLKTANVGKPRYIAFNYEDGLFIWEVDNNYTLGRGGRNDRGCDEFSTMAFIKKENLKRWSDVEVIMTEE